MAVKPNKKKLEGLAALDYGPHVKAVEEATKAAVELLSRYGKPTMSREELRKAVAKALPDQSLSEYVIKEREAQR